MDMAIHYNAFISYRHHPDDIRVAEEIHRRLERFHVPKALRKKSKKIERIFRDKEELPITSSLTSDIYEAIENSDYLIVICSVHTKESIWVQREIETFLKTHDHSKVLTVLASGEPYDVIPEILLHIDEEDPETGEIVRTDIEPLSCDWRVKHNKAIREELPRLAAALLNCGYDELRQRQRQYRMRRMIIGFSAALVASLSLTAYFLHTSIQIQKANTELNLANIQIQKANVEIQENLTQALRNQSQYLASSAQERLDAGDRLTAISLALAALPDGTEERPYVAAAEATLSKALSSYVGQDSIEAVGAFTGDAMLISFCVTEDGSLIYIRDANNYISIWDTATFQKRAGITIQETIISDMSVTPTGDLLVSTDGINGMLYCYDPDGTLLWQVDQHGDHAYLTGRTELMVLNHNSLTTSSIRFLDVKTGEETRPAAEFIPKQETVYALHFHQEEFDESMPIPLSYHAEAENGFLLLDLQDKTLTHLISIPTEAGATIGTIDGAATTAGGNLILMISDGSGMYNGMYQTMQVTSPARNDLYCYNMQTRELLWQAGISTTEYSGETTICTIPDTEHILCQNGNTVQIYHETTGELIQETNFPSIPMTMTVETDKTTGILYDGSSYTYQHEENTCYATNFMEGNVNEAVVCHGAFIRQSLSTQVTLYRSVHDESGESFDGTHEVMGSQHARFDNYLAIYDYGTLNLFDLAAQKLLWTKEFESIYDLIGFSSDGSSIILCDEIHDMTAICATADGKLTEGALPEEHDEVYTALDSNLFLLGDALCYVLESTEGARQLIRLDCFSGKIDAVNIPAIPSMQEMEYSENLSILAANSDYFWFWCTDGSVYELTLADASIRTVCEGLDEEPPVLWDAAHKQLILGTGHEILLWSPARGTAETIALGERKAVSFCPYDAQLLVLCDDAQLYRYDETGTQLSKSTLEVFNTFFSNIGYSKDRREINWTFTNDGDLLLNCLGAGNLIDTDQWQKKAYVPYLSAYCSDTNKLICRTDYQLVAYQCRSLQRQIQLAIEALNGYELSEEEKIFYGIG